MKRSRTTLIYSIPALIFGGILLYFVILNLYKSFLDSSLIHSKPIFVGFQTYFIVFHDSSFVSSLERTLIWCGALVAGGNAIGVFLGAFIFNLKIERVKTLFTSIFIYPLAISSAAAAVIWTWLFNINSGINTIIGPIVRSFGVAPPLWLDSPKTAFPSLVIVSLWMYSGISALFYLAAFQNVDRSVIESSKVDSAGPIRVLREILLPNAKNAFIVSTAILFLFALRIFSLSYVALGINPFEETAVVKMYFYYTTEYFSQSSVVSIVLVVIAIVVVIPYALYGLKRWMINES
jgi:glucose/arabinose transport system permease protein